jgi:hypothetical protein
MLPQAQDESLISRSTSLYDNYTTQVVALFVALYTLGYLFFEH